MNSDRARQAATFVAIIITLVVNTLAVALPLGGMTTQQISDSFRVFVIPSGRTFAVWSVIYTLLVAFAVYQALPSRREDPLLRRIGWLPVLGCAFNAGWIFLWQYRIFVPTLVAMLGLLVTLIVTTLRIRAASPVGRAERWLVGATFSIYLGWITVATILNVAVALVSLGVTGIAGIPPELIGAVVLVAGIAIALAAIVREHNAAYGFVVAWAYAGIWMKEGATPYVGPVAIAGTALVIVVALVVALGGLRGLARPIARAAAGA